MAVSPRTINPEVLYDTMNFTIYKSQTDANIALLKFSKFSSSLIWI